LFEDWSKGFGAGPELHLFDDNRWWIIPQFPEGAHPNDKEHSLPEDYIILNARSARRLYALQFRAGTKPRFEKGVGALPESASHYKHEREHQRERERLKHVDEQLRKQTERRICRESKRFIVQGDNSAGHYEGKGGNVFPDQRWQLLRQTDGTFLLKNRASDRVLFARQPKPGESWHRGVGARPPSHPSTPYPRNCFWHIIPLQEKQNDSDASDEDVIDMDVAVQKNDEKSIEKYSKFGEAARLSINEEIQEKHQHADLELNRASRAEAKARASEAARLRAEAHARSKEIESLRQEAAAARVAYDEHQCNLEEEETTQKRLSGAEAEEEGGNADFIRKMRAQMAAATQGMDGLLQAEVYPEDSRRSSAEEDIERGRKKPIPRGKRVVFSKKKNALDPKKSPVDVGPCVEPAGGSQGGSRAPRRKGQRIGTGIRASKGPAPNFN
jgi:hypothetical protein